MGDVTGPLAFIGVTPCRIVDTRGPTGPYGGPALAAGVPRNFALPVGPCSGIPSLVSAYSLNITATNSQGPGFILAYPQGASQPLVSTLNYAAGQTIANAAVVPAGIGGGITLTAGVSGTDVIVDIDGYFTSSINDPQLFALAGNGTLGVLEVRNTNTSFGAAIRGRNVGNADFNAAIEASADSFNGRVFGITAITHSNTPGAAGVYGADFDTEAGLAGSALTAGIWGQSIHGYGVIGISPIDGVKGVLIDTGGNVLSSGHLGHDATNGVFAIGNVGATGAKSFIEPHPTDAGKAVVYVALEGPEAGTYFRGKGAVHGGTGVIPVPESFRLVSDEEGLTVQITPIRQATTVAVLSADLSSIVVASPVEDLEFYYVVNGVRKAFKTWDPMGQMDYFVPEGPDARMPAGLVEEQRRRLIANGTYNKDGTVNMRTAERAGWTKLWADATARAAASDSNPVAAKANGR